MWKNISGAHRLPRGHTMMRRQATEEFKMKCRNDHKREKLGHYADLRNGG